MQKTTFDFEILLHDDASTDGTTDIVREYAAAYPDLIRPVVQTENQYSSKTRAIITTYLLPLAKGKYIALCEGDDYWTDPLKLQKQIDILESDPGISICTHAATKIYTDGRRKTSIQYSKNQVAPMTDVIRWKHRYWPTASFVYRKELMKNYPEACLKCHAGDVALVMYLATQGQVYCLTDVMSVYCIGLPGSHGDRFKALDDAARHRAVQTEFEMLDHLNALSNYAYNTDFITRKLQFQSNLLIKRKEWDTITYDGFFEDLRKVSFAKRISFLFRIYLLPVLRGYIFRPKKGR